VGEEEEDDGGWGGGEPHLREAGGVPLWPSRSPHGFVGHAQHCWQSSACGREPYQASLCGGMKFTRRHDHWGDDMLHLFSGLKRLSGGGVRYAGPIGGGGGGGGEGGGGRTWAVEGHEGGKGGTWGGEGHVKLTESMRNLQRTCGTYCNQHGQLTMWGVRY